MADMKTRPSASRSNVAAGRPRASDATTRRGAAGKPTPRKQTRKRTKADDAVRARPTALVGIAVAAWSALLGIAVLVCLTLAAWVTATHHDDAIRPAIATALQAWLVAQHAAIGLGGGGSFALMPLGLTIMLGAILLCGGRLTVRFSGGSDLLDAAMSTLALALPYAIIAALLTTPARDGGSHPSPLGALGGSFALALVCGSVGALRETGQTRAVIDKIPAAARAAVRAGVAAAAIVVGCAAIGYALALGSHAGRAANLVSSAHGGYAGAVLIAVISMAYAPNAVMWTASYSLGPGFAVGTHTSVSLLGAHLGAVPAFPLLAPLPGASVPIYAWLVILGPLVAGIVAGWLLSGATAIVPDAETPWWHRYRILPAARGLAGGVVAAVVLAVLAALSAGSLGGGRMSALGPSAWWVVLFGAAEIGGVAAAVIWLRGWAISGGWAALRVRVGAFWRGREIRLP